MIAMGTGTVVIAGWVAAASSGAAANFLGTDVDAQ
jgi:hypothetical protein